MVSTGSAESHHTHDICFATTEHLNTSEPHEREMAVTLTEILSQIYCRHQSKVVISRPGLCFPIEAPRSMTNTVASLSAISIECENVSLASLLLFVVGQESE